MFYTACLNELRPSLKISHHSPDSEYLDIATMESKPVSITLEFSEAVNKNQAEHAFSVKVEGQDVPGQFTWEGDKVMHFTSQGSVKKNSNYLVTETREVETLDGLSMEEDFSFHFSTSPESQRPSVVTISPTQDSKSDDVFMPIVFTFSEGMDSASTYQAFSISPTLRYAASWNTDQTTLTIKPLEPYTLGQSYTVTLASTATDKAGNQLLEEKKLAFHIGTEDALPHVLGVYPLHKKLDGTLVAAGMSLAASTDSMKVNEGIESTDAFSIVFDRPVETASLRSNLTVAPYASYTVDTSSEYSATQKITFSERLNYQELYTLEIKAGLRALNGMLSDSSVRYYLHINGDVSRPPEVTQLAFLNASNVTQANSYLLYTMSNNPSYTNLSLSASMYPQDAHQHQGSLELLIKLSPSAKLDIFSLMENFSISTTNSCAQFTITGMQEINSSPSLTKPGPEYALVRINFNILNSTDSGLVTFKIAKNFHDSLGNNLGQDFILPLNK